MNINILLSITTTTAPVLLILHALFQNFVYLVLMCAVCKYILCISVGFIFEKVYLPFLPPAFTENLAKKKEAETAAAESASGGKKQSWLV